MSGLAGKPGLSTANKNAFNIDGTLYKLPTMDMVEGFDHKSRSPIERVHIQSRGSSGSSSASNSNSEEISGECDLWFEQKFRMEADVNAVIVLVHEIYEQGFINGWC